MHRLRSSGYATILVGLPVACIMLFVFLVPLNELYHYFVVIGRKLFLAFAMVSGLALFDRWKGIEPERGDNYFAGRFLAVAIIMAFA